MEKKKFQLTLLPGKYGICHFDKNNSIPAWTENLSFCSITRTASELSIICPEEKIPGGVLAEKDWRVFKVEGPLGFVLTGVVASLAKPLAEENISIFYISEYETDYLMVENKNLEKTKAILSNFCEIN